MKLHISLVTGFLALAMAGSAHADRKPALTMGKDGWILRTKYFRFDTTFQQLRNRPELKHLVRLGNQLDRRTVKISRMFSTAPPDTRLVLEVFATQMEYQAFTEHSKFPDLRKRGGWYDPKARRLVTYYRSNDSLARVLFHEGTHQVLHYLFPGADFPVWLNEGLAMVLEVSKMKSGRIDVSNPNAHPLKQCQSDMANAKRPSIHRLVRLDYDSYHTDNYGPNDRRNYAWSWALVHYLLNTRDPGDRALMKTISTRIQYSQDPSKNLFDVQTCAVLDRRLQSWIRKLVSPLPPKRATSRNGKP